jgi:hypothetical protein
MEEDQFQFTQRDIPEDEFEAASTIAKAAIEAIHKAQDDLPPRRGTMEEMLAFNFSWICSLAHFLMKATLYKVKDELSQKYIDRLLLDHFDLIKNSLMKELYGAH